MPKVLSLGKAGNDDSTDRKGEARGRLSLESRFGGCVEMTVSSCLWTAGSDQRELKVILDAQQHGVRS